MFFLLMTRRPPRSTLFPYTTLFRSRFVGADRPSTLGRILVHELMHPARSGESVFAETLKTELERLRDRKSTRLNSSHSQISYAVFCLKKKNNIHIALVCRKKNHSQG